MSSTRDEIIKWANLDQLTSVVRPHLWVYTSINDGCGKYVADRKFDPTANANAQVGVAAILNELWLAGDIEIDGEAEQSLE